MPFEPFLQACAAESVEAVEEGEGLVEDFGADLLGGRWISLVWLWECAVRGVESGKLTAQVNSFSEMPWPPSVAILTLCFAEE